MKSLSIHSNKGGVGKTTISVNIAVYLSKLGYNVVLLDNDFSGPALFTFFESYVDFPKINYLNDYFEEGKKIKDILIPISRKMNLAGELFIAFADPGSDRINKMLALNEKEASRMLVSLAKLKRELTRDPFNSDFLIIDSAPGIGLTSINSFVNSDFIMFVVKLSNADIFGSLNMISGLLDNLQREIIMVGNMIPPSYSENTSVITEIENLIQGQLSKLYSEHNLRFGGWLPTDETLQDFEFEIALKTLRGIQTQRKIFTLVEEDHLFSKVIANIVNSILFDIE